MIIINDMIKRLQEEGLLVRVTGADCGTASARYLTCDSRRVLPGTLFICKGEAFRREYLQEAADGGSIAYISEQYIETNQNLMGLIVTDIRKTMATASAAFYGYEPGSPVLTGITGTKGKTTTAWYLKAMLDRWQAQKGKRESGLLSTVSNYDGVRREEAVMTTPEAPVLHEYLANARDSGTEYMTMEVSSQALKYKRVRGLRFSVGVFLNISEDHISPREHVDFEDYFTSKLSMFRQADTACVNLDSDYAKRIVRAARRAGRTVTFGRHPDADLRCSDIQVEHGKISFRATCSDFSETFVLAMRGKFNVENAMAAIAAAWVYGVPVSCMKHALAEITVPGRMETFESNDGKICGIVDFAHNRLSFEKLFDAVYQEYPKYRKIITIFGCPGGKAKNRRRELGIIAGLFSDYDYITSDDPGMECVERISDEIRGYVEMVGCGCSCIPAREDAVDCAVKQAAKSRERTLILVLGRGSERYQQIGSRRYACHTDSELFLEALSDYEAERPCCDSLQFRTLAV